MKRLLLTGATGMLGSHLLEEIQGKYEILALGRREKNIILDIDYKLVDLRDVENADYIVNDFEPEIIIHAAANGAEGTGQSSPIDMTSNGYNTFYNVITPAIATGKLKRFIYISSAAVYGDIETPYKESQEPKPHDIYAITKYSNELALKCLADVYNFEYTIIRPHNIVGERQDYTNASRNVVVLFMQLMRLGKPPIIFGDGSSARCYTYVKDVVKVIAQCIDYRGNLTINVGSDEQTSIKNLYETIKEVSGIQVEAIYKPDRKREVEKNSVDHTLARSLFEYNQTPFREIIEKTWTWIDKQPLTVPTAHRKEIVIK